MRYLRAYKFVFASPNWTMNLLWASLCLLSTAVIPAIGQIVLQGYLFEIIEVMHRRKSDANYPNFTFDRFVKYLLRGVWVFLVQLILSIPMILLIVPFYVVFFIMMFASEGEPDATLLIFVLVFIVLVFFVALIMSLVMVPLTLKAGLGQDFKGAFSMAFLKDFLAKMWLQVLLVQLFMTVTSIPLILIGFLFCFVGVYPAASLVTFAQFHFHYQLYELYLERGGMEIPLKEDDLPPIAD